MTKVYRIERTTFDGIHKDAEAKALYQAAGKVFEIPPFDTVVEAVINDNFAPMKEYLEGMTSLHDGTPFTGPMVFRDIMSDSAINIIADGGREIVVTPEHILIDFRRDGDGSTIAAGEVIGHIWASDPGDRVNGIMVRCSDGYIDVNDYGGPVHPQLGRTCYDAEFRRKFESGELKWFQNC